MKQLFFSKKWCYLLSMLLMISCQKQIELSPSNEISSISVSEIQNWLAGESISYTPIWSLSKTKPQEAGSPPIIIVPILESVTGKIKMEMGVESNIFDTNQIYQCLLFTKIDNKISCQLMQFLDTNAKSTDIVLISDVKTHTIINGWKYENEQFVGNIIGQKLVPQKVTNGRTGEMIINYDYLWNCMIISVKMEAGILTVVIECPATSGGTSGGGPMNPIPYPVIIPVVGSNPVSAGNIFGSGSPNGINVLLSSFKTLCNNMNAPLSAEEEIYLTGNSSLMISILSENNGSYLAPAQSRPNLGPLGNYIRNKYCYYSAGVSPLSMILKKVTEVLPNISALFFQSRNERGDSTKILSTFYCPESA